MYDVLRVNIKTIIKKHKNNQWALLMGIQQLYANVILAKNLQNDTHMLQLVSLFFKRGPQLKAFLRALLLAISPFHPKSIRLGEAIF